MRNSAFLLSLFSCLFLNFVTSHLASDNDSSVKLLSRRKRYVSFPEGSSFSNDENNKTVKYYQCAGCVTLGVIGQPAKISNPGLYTFGLNWGLAYELPNSTDTVEALYKLTGKRKPELLRRNRRDLYQKIETLINTMGYDGRACVLKTLCETTQRILPRGTNVIQEIFRTLFTLPITKSLIPEELEMQVYDKAHRIGLMMQDCDQQYKTCPLSLVDLVKGYYDAKLNRDDFFSNPLSLFMPSSLH